MNSHTTNGPWQFFKVQLRKTWSLLTDADLAAICRDRDELTQVVQNCYSVNRCRCARPLRVVERISLVSERLLAAAEEIDHC